MNKLKITITSNAYDAMLSDVIYIKPEKQQDAINELLTQFQLLYPSVPESTIKVSVESF